MLDIGWSELMVIGVVALIVVGPKDLPVMFRTLGRFTAKARSMAREFQRAMDDAAKASGVKETMKDMADLTSKKSLGITALESAADKFEKWSPIVPVTKPKGASPTPTLASALSNVSLPPNPVASTAPVAPAEADHLLNAGAPVVLKEPTGAKALAAKAKTTKAKATKAAPVAKEAPAKSAPAAKADAIAKPKTAAKAEAPIVAAAPAATAPKKPRAPRSKKPDA